MTDRLLENDSIVAALQDALSRGEHGLKAVPALVIRVIDENRWGERTVRVIHETVRFQSFMDFVTKAPPAGLGTDLRTLKRLCADDTQATDLIDRAEQRPPGKPDHTFNNIQGLSTAPVGTSRQASLRRLRKDRPDLHQQVLAGDLSAHAAMIQAGFRPKTVTVRATVEGFTRAIQAHLTAEDLARLLVVLSTPHKGEP
jgi:hypothetical protein